MARFASVNIVALSLVIAAQLSVAQVIVLNSPRVTGWGDWGPMELCPPGSYVYGMRVKTESDQGFFGDDSALNGIELLCLGPSVRRNTSDFLRRDPLARALTTVTSTVGHEGDFGSVFECPDPHFASGFELRSEQEQGWYDDDSAANNLKLYCQGGVILDGDGMSFGTWTGQQTCPRGSVLCGIQTQVEGPSSTDDSTLNNVNMGCCSL